MYNYQKYGPQMYNYQMNHPQKYIPRMNDPQQKDHQNLNYALQMYDPYKYNYRKHDYQNSNHHKYAFPVASGDYGLWAPSEPIPLGQTSPVSKRNLKPNSLFGYFGKKRQLAKASHGKQRGLHPTLLNKKLIRLTKKFFPLTIEPLFDRILAYMKHDKSLYRNKLEAAEDDEIDSKTAIEEAKRGFWGLGVQEKKDKVEAAEEGDSDSSATIEAAMKNFWAIRGKKEDSYKDLFWSLR